MGNKQIIKITFLAIMKNKKLKNLLYALSIGDGYINKSSSGNCTLDISHSIKQIEYLRFKSNLIGELTNSCPIIKISYTDKSKQYLRCRMRFTHPYLKFVYRNLYKNNIKTLTKTSVNKIDELGLAIIFMDDGGHTKLYYKNSRKIRGVNVILSLMFLKKESEFFIDWCFNKFNIKFNLLKVTNKSYYRLRCGTKEGRKLTKIIEPYFIDSLKYKLVY